jgi:hypothetical protein
VQPAVGADQGERPVARVDHVGQPSDLGRVGDGDHDQDDKEPVPA